MFLFSVFVLFPFHFDSKSRQWKVALVSEIMQSAARMVQLLGMLPLLVTFSTMPLRRRIYWGTFTGVGNLPTGVTGVVPITSHGAEGQKQD